MPGDLDWWYCQAWPATLADRLRLWTTAGEVVGWSWHDEDELDWEVWSGDPLVDAEIARAIVERTLEEVAAGADGIGSLKAWVNEDDRDEVALLEGLGFVPTDKSLSQFVQPIEATHGLADAPLPDGYRIRSVIGPSEIPARVEVHRAAFAPSKMSVEKYGRLVGLPAYRYEDDRVVEAPDGTLVAFAMAWWDPVARVGEFEPVGTHPDHQRRGLGKALLTDALHRFRGLGARLVQVYSAADNPGSEALYQSVGFRRRSYHRRYRRPGPAESAAAASAADTIEP
jgi:ribosomal protein S18 acetylase RimI-like enzyme